MKTTIAALEGVRMRSIWVSSGSDVGCFGGGFFLAMVFRARLGGVLLESSLEVERGEAWYSLPFASVCSRPRLMTLWIPWGA